MKRFSGYAAIILIVGVLASVQTVARDLEVTVVGGRECYVYDVKKKESIYDVSRELGIPTVEITRYNPSAADGLREGMRLYVPRAIVDKGRPAVSTSVVTAPVAASEPVVTVPAAGTVAGNDDVDPQVDGNGTYTVKRGESLYGISRKCGIDMEDLIALNPSAEYGVKAGDVLVVKAPGTTARDAETEYGTPVAEPVSAVTAYDDDKYSLIPGERRISSEIVAMAGTPVDDDVKVYDDTVNMAVILPFMLNGDDPGKNARLFIEFYKGFLLAADSLKSMPGNHVNIYAYDSAASADSIAAIMRRPEMAGMDFIIGPDNEAHLQQIADGMMSSTRLYTTFNVRSDLYTSDARVVQANIPHSPMLGKAVDAFVDMYASYTPVFLSRIDGAADKDAFTSLLKQRLAADTVGYCEITFRNLLSHRDLDTLDVGRDYVFVPVSGSRAEFAKISEAITRFGNSRPDRSTRLFGYPDWITFRGEYLNRLCELEATIYTRFFADMNDTVTKSLCGKFADTYGTEMLDAAPVQGILGFDTGMYLLSKFKEYGRGFADHHGSYNGLQSAMNFIRRPGCGEVNDALLIVTFAPDGQTIRTVIE